MLAEFLLTAVVVAALPGTGVVFTLTAALSGGGRAGLVAAFGCTLGIVPHVVAALTGLAALLHASAVAFAVVKWLGVAWLAYLAFVMLAERGVLTLEPERAGVGGRRPLAVIGSAVLVNLLNPKLSLFFLAFLPQFVPADDPAPLGRMLALSGLFMLVTFAVFAVYGLFAASVRRRLAGRPGVVALMRKGFAAALLALSARLALAGR